jgi:AbrB family looped-hinge helix DNA binding protein
MVLTNGECHFLAAMTTKITIDKAGRIVIPKPLRERLRLGAGDTLALQSEERASRCSLFDPRRR